MSAVWAQVVESGEGAVARKVILRGKGIIDVVAGKVFVNAKGFRGKCFRCESAYIRPGDREIGCKQLKTLGTGRTTTKGGKDKLD